MAFPVGVFSDLWSQELKKVKGFDDLLNDDDDNDEDEDEDNANVNGSNQDGDKRKETETPEQTIKLQNSVS